MNYNIVCLEYDFVNFTRLNEFSIIIDIGIHRGKPLY